MYGWCHIVFTTALLAQTVHTASILPKNERCVTATYTALNYLSFAGETTTGFWQTRCQNRLKVTSIYAAAEVYCDEDERIAGFAQLDELCRSSANIELLPRQTVAENLTKEKIKQMEIVDFLGTPRDEVLDSPVLISSAYYDRVFRTIVRDIAIHTGGKT
jgi:ferric-chelate reductase